jgi:hypothetical protein
MKVQSDIRNVLRRDHVAALGALDALRAEHDEARGRSRLRRARRSWVVHALAEEAVVYRALEGVAPGGNAEDRADQRFVEHDLIDGMFDKLTRVTPGSHEWNARVNVLRDVITRHIANEQELTFDRLGARFSGDQLGEMALQFGLVRDKLTLLEEAKVP